MIIYHFYPFNLFQTDDALVGNPSMTPARTESYEYALNITNYCLINLKDNNFYLDMAFKLRELLRLMRLVESPDDQIQTCIPIEIINLYEKANELQKYCFNVNDDSKINIFQFNDNRYEQHNGIWEGKNSYQNTISLNGLTRLLFK